MQHQLKANTLKPTSIKETSEIKPQLTKSTRNPVELLEYMIQLVLRQQTLSEQKLVWSNYGR